MNLQAMESRVILLPDTVEEKIGNILIPQDTQERHQMAQIKATVVSIGDVAFTHQDGQKWRDAPEVGDRVVIAKYAGLTITEDKKNYRIVNDVDVAAKVV